MFWESSSDSDGRNCLQQRQLRALHEHGGGRIEVEHQHGGPFNFPSLSGLGCAVPGQEVRCPNQGRKIISQAEMDFFLPRSNGTVATSGRWGGNAFVKKKPLHRQDNFKVKGIPGRDRAIHMLVTCPS
jgi:hypothetical protein